MTVLYLSEKSVCTQPVIFYYWNPAQYFSKIKEEITTILWICCRVKCLFRRTLGGTSGYCFLWVSWCSSDRQLGEKLLTLRDVLVLASRATSPLLWGLYWNPELALAASTNKSSQVSVGRHIDTQRVDTRWWGASTPSQCDAFTLTWYYPQRLIDMASVSWCVPKLGAYQETHF